MAALFIDKDAPALQEYLKGQRVLRIQRAQEIGDKLDKQGFTDSYNECVKERGKVPQLHVATMLATSLRWAELRPMKMPLNIILKR